MSELTNIKEFKSKKKYKKLVEDIDQVVRVLEMSQTALSHFKYIIACQEIISIMETNKTLLVLKQKDLKKEIEKC